MTEEHLGGCITYDNFPGFGKGDVGTWAPQVWDKLIETYQPKSLIDVGCGAGFSTEYFLQKGLEILGVEGYLPAIESSPIKEYIHIHDFIKSEFIPEKKYDLGWCCEFVEHVEEQYTNNFMITFSNCSVVAMTHGVPGQPGFHHVNCQPATYWIEKFKTFGFSYNEMLSLECRALLPSYTDDSSFIPNGSHVKNTLMIFEKI
jgi:hypothetical protein